MPDATTLLAAAIAAGFYLNKSEQKLLQAVEKGEDCIFREHEGLSRELREEYFGKQDLPSIDAALLYWLLSNAKARRFITHKGINLSGARIRGKLDISCVDFPYNLGLFFCHLPQGLVARDARLGSLRLRASRTGPIAADRVHVAGNVFLDEGFQAVGEVRFLDATIKGQLICGNGSFANKNGYAITADGMQVGGAVFLHRGFKAVGGVRLLGATIKGQLICTNGSFSNEKRDALNPQDITVMDSVEKRNALNAQGITVMDSIVLDQEFQAEGIIDLSRATINGALIMRKWKRDALPEISLDLRGAKAGILKDAKSAWPHKGNLFLDGFSYDSIHEESPISAEDRLDWLDRQDDNRFRSQPYEQLAKVLRLYGQEQDAREVLYQKNNKLLWFLTHGSLARRRKWYRKQLKSKTLEEPLASYYQKMPGPKNKDLVHDYTPRSRGWWRGAWWWSGYLRIGWMWLLRLSVGFGYKSWIPVFRFLYLFVIGCMFFWCADLHGLMTPAQQYVHLADVPEHLPRSQEWLRLHQHDASLASLTANDYPDFSPVIHAMDTFIPLVNLGQETYWIPNVHASSLVRFCGYELFTATGRMVRWFLVGYILMGWLLTTLIVASLTGLLKK